MHFWNAASGGPIDVATAYFAISGYRLVKERLHQMGAMRLLIGADPKTGADVGLRPDRRQEYLKLLRGDVEAEPFSEETLRLVEELIAFLRSEKVQVRLYDKGFLHAKAYLFHQDRIGPHNRRRPAAALCGHRRVEQFHRAGAVPQPRVEPGASGAHGRRRGDRQARRC